MAYKVSFLNSNNRFIYMIARLKLSFESLSDEGFLLSDNNDLGFRLLPLPSVFADVGLCLVSVSNILGVTGTEVLQLLTICRLLHGPGFDGLILLFVVKGSSKSCSGVARL